MIKGYRPSLANGKTSVTFILLTNSGTSREKSWKRTLVFDARDYDLRQPDPVLEGFLLDSEFVVRTKKQGRLEKRSRGLEGYDRLVSDNQERWEKVRDRVWSGSKQYEYAPELMPVSTQFADDVKAFFVLFLGDELVKLLVRRKNIREVKYGFGDASGAGFGALFVKAGDEDKIYFRYGRWGSNLDSSSSNFREVNNLVEYLQEIVKEQSLGGVEIYVFTDN